MLQRSRLKQELNKSTGIARQWRAFATLPQKPRSHVKILTYQTGAIDVAEILILTYLNETGIILIRNLIIIRKLEIFLTVECSSFPLR